MGGRHKIIDDPIFKEREIVDLTPQHEHTKGRRKEVGRLAFWYSTNQPINIFGCDTVANQHTLLNLISID